MMTIFLKLELWWRKRKALFEIEKDLLFISEVKAYNLNYDERKARARYKELKGVENPTDKDSKEMVDLEKDIAASNAVKKEYEDLRRLQTDLPKYISRI